MREIKFRAWDKGDRKMKSVLILQIGFGATSYDYADDNVAVGTDDSNRVLMQYTGVKDKNGKEIYEGDIVKCNFAWGDNVCEIVEEKGCYWVSQKNREIEDQAHDNLHWHNEGCEIIGNIYENPELIETHG